MAAAAETSTRSRLGDQLSGSFFRQLANIFVMAISGLLVLVIVIVPLDLDEQMIFAGMTLIALLVLGRSPSRRVTVTLALLSMVVSTRYIYWRTTETLEFETYLGAFLGTGLYFAELYAWLVLFLGYLQTAWPLHRPIRPLPPDNVAEWPTVDIYVPTYNEDMGIVADTVLAATNMDYPADKLRVYLLDDGRRPEFRKFAEAAGVGYISRPDNIHAKAGNLNNSLRQTGGDFIIVFDCDHVPTRGFVQLALGWFLEDPKLALLQTPHHFYTPDPFQRNLESGRSLTSEGDLFYHVVQLGNDFWNATFFCGSCAVMRRTALLEVGGFPGQTVTEDAHTALKMQKVGWNSAYLNIRMAAGLATDSMSVHIGQRIRWARGMTQILRVENPLFGGQLTFAQRLCYLNAMLHFQFAFPRIVFLTAPLAYLIFGQNIIAASAIMIVAYAGPHLIHAVATNSRTQGKYRRPLMGEVYESALCFHLALPTLVTMFAPKRGKFNVTQKGGSVDSEFFDVSLVRPHLICIGALILGAAFGFSKLLFPGTFDVALSTLLLNVGWTIFNSIVLLCAIAVARETRHPGTAIPLAVDLPATVYFDNGHTLTTTTKTVSMAEAAVAFPDGSLLDKAEVTHVELPSSHGETVYPVEPVEYEKDVLTVAFRELDLVHRRELVDTVFGRADAWTPPIEEHGETVGRSFFEILTDGLGVFRRLNAEPVKKRRYREVGAPALEAEFDDELYPLQGTGSADTDRSSVVVAYNQARAESGQDTKNVAGIQDPNAIAARRAEILRQHPAWGASGETANTPQPQEEASMPAPSLFSPEPQAAAPASDATERGLVLGGEKRDDKVDGEKEKATMSPFQRLKAMFSVFCLALLLAPAAAMVGSTSAEAQAVAPGAPIPADRPPAVGMGQATPDFGIGAPPVDALTPEERQQQFEEQRQQQFQENQTGAQQQFLLDQGMPSGDVERPDYQSNAVSPRRSNNTEYGPVRNLTFTLKDLGIAQPLRMITVQGEAGIPFTVRRDEVVTQAKLTLTFGYSPSLIADLSHLAVSINGELIGTVQLIRERSGGVTVEFPINPALLLTRNTLNFRFVGHYTMECEDPLHSSLWLIISNTDSFLEMTVQRLPSANDLKALPLPFYDNYDMVPLDLPFVFAGAPTNAAIQAGAAVASYFGQIASFRGFSFPVYYGTLPPQNAVVFATTTDSIPGISLPPVNGPTVAVVNNPADPLDKLLLVLGRNPEEMRQAANTIAVGATTLTGAAAAVGPPVIQPRKPYDAPRWLPLDKPVAFGELIDPLALQGVGLPPGALTVSFRAPPDLFAWRKDGFPVNVRYRYPSGDWLDRKVSRLDVSFNNRYLKSFPLIGDTTFDQLQSLVQDSYIEFEGEVRLPPYQVYGQNELQFYFDLKVAKEGECRGQLPENVRSGIDPDSTIDLTSAAHYVKMPNLSFFASSGFPFTRLADLSETIALIAPRPSNAELSGLFEILGRFADSTGVPITALNIARGAQGLQDRDKHILIVGTVELAANLGNMLADAPFRVEGGQLRVDVNTPIERVFEIVSGNTSTGAEEADKVLVANNNFTGLVSFRSPYASDRVVVAALATNPQDLPLVIDQLEDPDLNRNIQGDLSIMTLQGNSNYRIARTFWAGSLPLLTSIMWYFSQHPILLVLLLLMAVAVLATPIYVLLRGLARGRLKRHKETG